MPKVQDALSRVEAGTGTSDRAELAALADTLARRLDAVIGRLDRALEG
jgi:hypothetical protein